MQRRTSNAATTWFTLASVALVTGLLTQPWLSAQAPEARLELSTSSESAKALFRQALLETQNIGGARARRPIGEAVKADPAFALARVYAALVGPESREDRARAIGEAIATMGSATPAELLLAVYWRETALGRAGDALPVLKAATDLVPDDPDVAWFHFVASRTSHSASEQLALNARFLERFPNHAAGHNQFAYANYTAGNLDAALRAAREYARLAPDHPNAHDTLGDMRATRASPSAPARSARWAASPAPWRWGWSRCGC
jgi:tetratricopeptide (TPR) repeat protein